MLKIATQEPVPPKTLRADVPSELDAVVRRALAKDRNKRTPSIAASCVRSRARSRSARR